MGGPTFKLVLSVTIIFSSRYLLHSGSFYPVVTSCWCLLIGLTRTQQPIDYGAARLWCVNHNLNVNRTNFVIHACCSLLWTALCRTAWQERDTKMSRAHWTLLIDSNADVGRWQSSDCWTSTVETWHIYIYIYTSSSIGTTAHCGLWPVEQCPSIFSYLPPTLSISHSQHLKISFYFLFPSFPGSSPSSRPFQLLSEDLFRHPILLHSL